MAGACFSGTLHAQGDASPLTKEYFVQQAADEALLIRITAFEAEFESKVFGQNRELLLTSSIPGSRIAPVFQYVAAPSNPRQLDIELSSSASTDRSEYELELTRLTIWDERSNAVSRAYQLLSFGMQTANSDSEANWTVKIDGLITASRLFQQFGMKEMRLWANYLAAQQIQFHLHDYSIVYTMCREILAELKGTRLQNIELATLQLQSVALSGLEQTGSLQRSADKTSPVQAALARAAKLAAETGFHYEQALALSASAAHYSSSSQYNKALEQYQLALVIADSVGDADLAKGIRESIVSIHEVQGNAPASSEVLQEIESQLAEEGAGDELALNLLAQGRLFIRNYRYSRAMKVLAEALNYQNDSSIRKQLNFELARVFYETGRLDNALTYLELAEITLDSSQRRRVNSVLDYGDALRIMANIYRARGEFDHMRRARVAQGQYKPSPAGYLYDRGLDETVSQKSHHEQARSFFRQSHEAARVTGLKDLEHLSRLQYCALGAASGSLCSTVSANSSYAWLLASGIPRQSTEAMYLWSQMLVNRGRHSEAVEVMERLTDEIHFLRYFVPGVLGSWYRERADSLFEYHLGLLVTNPGQNGQPDDSASLLALSKIRLIEAHAEPSKDSADTDSLRARLAQRLETVKGKALTDLAGEINRDLARLRGPFKKQIAYLSNAGLQNYTKGLGSNEAVLTYHISPTTAQVWIVHKGRVQRRAIANAEKLHEDLLWVSENLSNLGVSSFDRQMDAVGEALLDPVSNLLTETIYWVPAGPLLGIPLDALRVKGRYLAERHKLINLVSFPSKVNPSASLKPGPLQRIFLAGHPQDYSGGFASRLDTSEEIRALADIFVGPGLNIVQGAALLPDEFRDDRFRNANLVHLTMPGVIDLKYPGQSRLELSGDETGPRRTLLWPENIQSQTLGASLVFLSSTRITASPRSAFDSRVGLVSDFLFAGAQSVISGLWASGGKTDQAFVTDFYSRLETSGDIADALASAKRQYLKNNRNTGLYGWAGYQLFID